MSTSRALAPRRPRAGEQLVDRARPGVLGEHALRDELADEGVEVDAGAAARVGRGREHPERREAERRDRAELDDVARALPHREPARVGLDLVVDRGVRHDAADELDRDAEQVPRGGLVEARAADDARQGELERLVEGPAEGRGQCADEALRHAQQEGEATHGR